MAIGIPGFFLALGPNTRRFQPGFVRRVLSFAIPAGIISALTVMLGYGLARAQEVPAQQARTAATIVFLVVSLWILVIQARPLRTWKVALLGAMGALSALSFALPPHWSTNSDKTPRAGPPGSRRFVACPEPVLPAVR